MAGAQACRTRSVILSSMARRSEKSPQASSFLALPPSSPGASSAWTYRIRSVGEGWLSYGDGASGRNAIPPHTSASFDARQDVGMTYEA